MALPNELIASLQNVRGFDEEEFKRVHNDGGQITSIRINPAKIDFKDLVESGTPISSDPIPVPWSTYGFYLSERPSFTLDPMLHAGAYYVQEASSMFLEQAFNQSVDRKQSLKVLDLCAAPGGKSTLIQSLLSNDSFLVSNEVIKSRANILCENMTKWGGANVVVCNNDPKDFARLESYFDVIVMDAPCSGSGLFRRDPNAIKEWSPENVQLCSQRQQRIIADVLPALKAGGKFIYSTCSYSEEENEAVLDWMMEEFAVESMALSIDKSWGITHSVSEKHAANGYRFYPDKVKGEGLFMAVLQKNDGTSTTRPSKKTNLTKPTKNDLAILHPWIREDAQVSFMKWKDDVLAFATVMENEMALLQQHLYLKQVGVNMGQLTSSELIPEHALATSRLLRADVNSISLNKEQALGYLRKADLSIDNENKKGWALVQYKEQALGWVKLLQNRINNYYPKEWRILK